MTRFKDFNETFADMWAIRRARKSMPDRLTVQLADLETKFDGYFKRADSRNEELSKQVELLDRRTKAHEQASMPARVLIENEIKADPRAKHMAQVCRGELVLHFEGTKSNQFLERKSITTTSLGTDGTGVVPIEREPGIVLEARRQLNIRDVLADRPTTSPLIYYVRVSTPMAPASPAPEGTLKAENNFGLSTVNTRVITIATWVKTSNQVLSDYSDLANFIDTSLRYAVDLAVEQQLLYGDGTSENLLGLTHQAITFDTNLLTHVASPNPMDVIGMAIAQVAAASERQPTFIVLHSSDWYKIRLTKDLDGRYILGHPQLPIEPSLFDRPVVLSNSLTPGTFLIGNGTADCVEVRDREQTTVAVSTEHEDLFIRNMCAIRGETRLALCVKRPGAFIFGSLNN